MGILPLLRRISMRLARKGWSLSNVLPFPLTLPAHCSILTGFYPPYHGVRVNGNNALRDDLTTLAEVFSSAGCGTAAL